MTSLFDDDDDDDDHGGIFGHDINLGRSDSLINFDDDEDEDEEEEEEEELLAGGSGSGMKVREGTNKNPGKGKAEVGVSDGESHVVGATHCETGAYGGDGKDNWFILSEEQTRNMRNQPGKSNRSRARYKNRDDNGIASDGGPLLQTGWGSMSNSVHRRGTDVRGEIKGMITSGETSTSAANRREAQGRGDEVEEKDEAVDRETDEDYDDDERDEEEDDDDEYDEEGRRKLRDPAARASFTLPLNYSAELNVKEGRAPNFGLNSLNITPVMREFRERFLATSVPPHDTKSIMHIDPDAPLHLTNLIRAGEEGHLAESTLRSVVWKIFLRIGVGIGVDGNLGEDDKGGRDTSWEEDKPSLLTLRSWATNLRTLRQKYWELRKEHTTDPEEMAARDGRMAGEGALS